MPSINPQVWAKHTEEQNLHHMQHGQADLIWVRQVVSSIPRDGNDEDKKFAENVTLKCLIEFNIKRVWPLTKYTESGEEDKQSMVAMLNIDYLQSLNLLDENKNFAYKPAEDKFIFRGVEYYSAGDTPVAQVQDIDLFYYLILRRTDFAT